MKLWILILYTTVAFTGLSQEPVQPSEPRIDDMTIPPQVFQEVRIEEGMVIVRKEIEHHTDPDFGGESRTSLLLKIPCNGLDSMYVLSKRQVVVDYQFMHATRQYSSNEITFLDLKLSNDGDYIWLKGTIELGLDRNPYNEQTRKINLSVTSRGSLKRKKQEYTLIDQKIEEEPEEILYQITELPAEFPGGPEAMMKYFKENLVYPDDAKEMQVQGRVYVSLVVEKDGSVSNVEVVRGVYSSLDKEAIRVVKSMPKWIPGEMDNKPVRSRVYLPITFRMG